MIYINYILARYYLLIYDVMDHDVDNDVINREHMQTKDNKSIYGNMVRSIVCLFLACCLAACAAERRSIPGCGKLSCIIAFITLPALQVISFSYGQPCSRG